VNVRIEARDYLADLEELTVPPYQARGADEEPRGDGKESRFVGDDDRPTAGGRMQHGTQPLARR
jgi:hypothetical protein